MKWAATMFSRVLLGLVAVASMDLLAATSAAQIQTLGASFETGGQGTLGFEFSVTEEVRVVRLGVFDGAGDGLAAQALVTLWLDADSAAPGNLPSALASVSVPAGTGAALVDHFRYVSIAPVTLSPGRLYVVGAYTATGEATEFNLGGSGSTGVFEPRIAQVMDRFWWDDSPGGNGNDFPIDSYYQPIGAWLGANFQLTAVPEPASASLLAAGLLGAALWRRRHGTASPAQPQN